MLTLNYLMVKRFVSIFPEKFSQKPVPVGMVADFQYRIQQRGDRYGTCRSPAGQLDVRFRYPDFSLFLYHRNPCRSR